MAEKVARIQAKRLSEKTGESLETVLPFLRLAHYNEDFAQQLITGAQRYSEHSDCRAQTPFCGKASILGGTKNDPHARRQRKAESSKGFGLTDAEAQLYSAHDNIEQYESAVLHEMRSRGYCPYQKFQPYPYKCGMDEDETQYQT